MFYGGVLRGMSNVLWGCSSGDVECSMGVFFGGCRVLYGHALWEEVILWGVLWAKKCVLWAKTECSMG